MTPQDVSDLKAADKIRKVYAKDQGIRAICYGMGDGLDEVEMLLRQRRMWLYLRQH